MDKDSSSISEKLLMMTLKLYDFVAYEIQHVDPSIKNNADSEQINLVYTIFNEKYTQIIKLVENMDATAFHKILDLEEPSFWMYKAYQTISLIKNPKMLKITNEKYSDTLIDSILYLCECITKHYYYGCLTDNDKEIEIRKGGVIYTDATGMITGYSKFVNDNKEIISDNRSALYLFKNVCDLHKKLKLDLKKFKRANKSIDFKYTVANPYFQNPKSKVLKEEHKGIILEQTKSLNSLQIYVEKWKNFKNLQVILTFEPVYFFFLVNIQGEFQRKKMKGFRVKVNINEKA